jgi:hypothetical protein
MSRREAGRTPGAFAFAAFDRACRIGPDVWSGHLVERSRANSYWSFPPRLVDVLVGCRAVEGFEAPAEDVSNHEVCEMSSKLVMVFVLEVWSDDDRLSLRARATSKA